MQAVQSALAEINFEEEEEQAHKGSWDTEQTRQHDDTALPIPLEDHLGKQGALRIWCPIREFKRVSYGRVSYGRVSL